MPISYKGVAVLTIWNHERTKYIQLYRTELSLPFQPEKGMKIVSKTKHSVIHDIEWDIEGGDFRIQIVQIERYIEDSFLDMDYLVHEATRSGWEQVEGEFGGVVDEPNETFKEYCFPFNELEQLEELDQRNNEERFKDVVLGSLDSIKQSLSNSSSVYRNSALIGAVVGGLTYILLGAIF